MNMFKDLRRSRKAMIFNIFLVILTVVVLTYAYIRLSEKSDVTKAIGLDSMKLITKVQEGEKALIFLDFAAKLAIYQAVYDLQAKGGTSEASACGTYYGFARWNSDSGKNCFVDVDSAKNTLRDLFVSSLIARVAAYPSADFVGNVPTAALSRGAALGSSAGVTASTQVTFTGEKKLSKEQKDALLTSLASKYGYELAVLKAIIAVEAGGAGFNSDDTLKIRMEPHVFNKRCGCTDGTWGSSTRVGRAIGGVSCEGGQVNEHACLQKAITINENAAYQSISMGLAQTMGFHAERLGYTNAKAMFEDYSRSESIQIEKFIVFLSTDSRLSQAVKDKDWSTVARIYNGDTTGRYASHLVQNYKPEQATATV
jgi:hypothetical protein